MSSKESLREAMPPLDFVPDVSYVHKCGGDVTSRPNVLEKILDSHEKSKNGIFVAVVSAFRGITPLLRQVRNDIKNTQTHYLDTLNLAFAPVRQAIEKTIDKYFPQNSEYRALALARAESRITACCYQIQPFIITLSQPGNVSWQNFILDQIIGVGENIARDTVSLFLESKGLDTKNIAEVGCDPIHKMGQSITDERLQDTTEAGIIFATKQQITEATQSLIYGGWIKGTPNGMLNEIGSNYSDAIAADVAASYAHMISEATLHQQSINEVDLSSHAIRIVLQKAVPKILSSHPGRVNSAQEIKNISLQNMLQAAASGESPIHPGPMTRVYRHNKKPHLPKLEITLANMNDPSEEGTTISDDLHESERDIDIITSNQDLIAITVNDPVMATEPGYVHALTKALTDLGISMQDIFTEGTSFWITASKKDLNLESFERAIQNLRQEGFDTNRGQKCIPETLQISDEFSTVSLIGNLNGGKHIGTVVSAITDALGIHTKPFTSTPDQRRITMMIPRERCDEAHRFIHSVLIEKDPDCIEQLKPYLGPKILAEIS